MLRYFMLYEKSVDLYTGISYNNKYNVVQAIFIPFIAEIKRI